MSTYYYAENGKQQGPCSLEELKWKNITPQTLVWKAGMADWQAASTLPELQVLFQQQTPPPVYIYQQAPKTKERRLEEQSDPYNYSKNAPNDPYDYSKIEDEAGVDYKKAIYIAAALLALNILTMYAPFNPLGIIVITGLAVAAWYYFKAYFDYHQDIITAKWITVIMAAHGVFCLAYLYAWSVDWQLLFAASALQGAANWFFGGGSNAYYSSMVFDINAIKFLVFGASIANFVAGFRILSINHKYPFPLKRIAVSTMLLLPFLFINYFIEGLYEGVQTNFFVRILLSLPYIFLLHHFYRADTEDATP